MLQNMSMKKYNIALVPEDKEYSLYIDSAQNNFKSIATGYLLGQKSLPHISLCQFECEADNPILLEIHKFIRSSLAQPIYPEFQSLNIVALQGEFKGQFAADLGIARRDDLLVLQAACSIFLEKSHLKPLNVIGNLYRPHLTLAFFKLQSALMLPSMPNQLIGASKHPFYVKLGQADSNWQYIRILKAKN